MLKKNLSKLLAVFLFSLSCLGHRVYQIDPHRNIIIFTESKTKEVIRDDVFTGWDYKQKEDGTYERVPRKAHVEYHLDRKMPRIKFYNNIKLSGKPVYEIKNDGFYRGKSKMCQKSKGYSEYFFSGKYEEKKCLSDHHCECHDGLMGITRGAGLWTSRVFDGSYLWVVFDKQHDDGVFEVLHKGERLFFKLERKLYEWMSPSNKNALKSFFRSGANIEKQYNEFMRCLEAKDDICLGKYLESSNYKEMIAIDNGEKCDEGALDPDPMTADYCNISGGYYFKDRFDVLKKCFSVEKAIFSVEMPSRNKSKFKISDSTRSISYFAFLKPKLYKKNVVDFYASCHMSNNNNKFSVHLKPFQVMTKWQSEFFREKERSK